MLLLACITVAYGQDCKSLLQQATELVSKKKYCDAKKLYQQYGNCNADADVSTEIAMCERFCKLQGTQGDESYTPATEDNKQSSQYTPSLENRSAVSPSNAQSVSEAVLSSYKSSFSGFQLHGGVFNQLVSNSTIFFNLGFKTYIPASFANGLSFLAGIDAFYGSRDNVSAILAPVFGGINYAYAVNSKFSIYGEATGGYSIYKVLISDSNLDMINGFTFSTETGVLLFGKCNIGVRYNYFSFSEGNLEGNLDGLSLTLGILF